MVQHISENGNFAVEHIRAITIYQPLAETPRRARCPKCGEWGIVDVCGIWHDNKRNVYALTCDTCACARLIPAPRIPPPVPVPAPPLVGAQDINKNDGGVTNERGWLLRVTKQTPDKIVHDIPCLEQAWLDEKGRAMEVTEANAALQRVAAAQMTDLEQGIDDLVQRVQDTEAEAHEFGKALGVAAKGRQEAEVSAKLADFQMRQHARNAERWSQEADRCQREVILLDADRQAILALLAAYVDGDVPVGLTEQAQRAVTSWREATRGVVE